MDESMTAQTEVIASYVLPFNEVFMLFPTLVLFGNKYQDLEDQFVDKLDAELISE